MGFAGFVNAVVLVEGLKRAGRDLTREKLIDAIDSIHQFPLGTANTLTYSPTCHQGVQQVYCTQVSDGKVVILTNWEQISKERSVPGATGNGILLGSSCPLSGHASFLGIQTIHGALACLNHINDQGGSTAGASGSSSTATATIPPE